MPGRNPKEAIDNYLAFITETLSCISDKRILAYQESDKIFKLLFDLPALVTARNGDRFYINITQTLTTEKRDDGLFKVHTRNYSYIFTDRQVPTTKGIVAYHWHPHEFNLRDPHLHLHITQNMGYPEIERKIARAHYPTSRVCLEDFILLLIKCYDIKPLLHSSTWSRIIRKNKDAFGKQATWFVAHNE